MNSLQKKMNNLINDHEEFLELSTFKEIDKRFKDYQIQHHFIYQKRQDQVVQKSEQEKQKQAMQLQKQPSENSEKDPFALTLSTRRTLLMNQNNENFSFQKEIKKVSTTLTPTNKSQSPKKQTQKKLNMDNLRDKLKKFTKVKDFIWFVKKLSKSSKKYDFLKDDEMCKQFGIELKKLDKIQSEELRSDYIYNAIVENLRQDIQNFDINNKQNLKQFDGQQEQLDKKFIKQFDSKKYDILDWIRIDSKYENLDKKIKLCLVENIHDPQNAEIIRQQLKEKQDKQKLNHKKQETRTIKFGIKQYTDIPSQVQSQENQQEQTSKKQNEKNDQLKNFEEMFEWNENREKDFKRNKQEVKNKLSQKIASSNWNDLSLIPIIQEVQVDQGITQYREQLIQKHKNRDQLTDYELQFLATTSELLNRNIDKNYVQKIIDQLDEQIIDQIENNIAEEIINKYNKVINVAKNKRNEYIKQKAIESGKHIQENDYFKKVKEEKDKHYHSSLMKNKIIEKMIDGYKMSEIKLHIHKPDSLLYSFAKSLSNRIDKDEPLTHTIHTKQWRQFYEKQVPNKNIQEKTIYTMQDGEPMTVEKSQRLFHPSSKLILNLDYIDPNINNQHDNQYVFTQKDIVLLKKQKKQMISQKQSAKHVDLESKKQYFKKFLSNGPLDLAEKYGSKEIQDSNIHYPLAKRNTWISDKIRENAAIIIQKNIRMRIAKNKVAMLDEQMYQSIIKRQKNKVINTTSSHTVKNFHQQIERQNTIAQQDSLRQDKPQSPSSSKYQQGGSLSSKERRIFMGMKFKHKQRLIEDRILEDDNVTSKSDISCSTRQASPKQSIPRSMQDSTFMSSTQGITSPTQGITSSTPTSNPHQRVDFSAFLDTIKNDRIRKSNSFASNFQNLVKFQSLQTGKLSFQVDSADDMPPMARSSSSQKAENKQSVFLQTLPTAASTAKLSQKKQRGNSANINILQAQLMNLNISTKSKKQKIIQEFSKGKQKGHQELHQKQDSIFQNSLVEKERIKNLELLRDKMYKNSLLVKQQKLLSAAIHNAFSSIKNAGYVLNKSDVNVKDKKGNSPLYYTVQNKNSEFSNFLTEMGANVNEICEGGNTPLHVAFLIGNDIMIMDFMDKGGDLNIINEDNQTPLAMGSFKLIKKMGLEKGVAKYCTNAKQGSNGINEIQGEQQYSNGALQLDLNHTISIDNNTLFRKAFKKNKEMFEMKNRMIKTKAKEQAFNTEIIQDISVIDNEQTMLFQFQSDLKGGSLTRSASKKKNAHVTLPS